MQLNTIPWDDSYKLEIELIDKQHIKLFEIVNRLYTLDDEHSTKDEIKAILYEFSDYMNTHFKEEEQYMASIEFPELKRHKQIHETFVQQLAELVKTPAKLGIIKTKMKVFAKRALIDHIKNEDTKIGKFKNSTNQESYINEEIFELKT